MWDVPASTHERAAGDPAACAWAAELPAAAADCARAWGLSSDGPAWAGHESVVWPVCRAEVPLALKLGRPERIPGEAAFLTALAGRAITPELHARDLRRSALLMDRLDGDRSLETFPDIDGAVQVIASALTVVHATPPPAEVPHVGTDARRIHDNIGRNLAEYPGVLARRTADRARDIISSAFHPGPDDVLLHGDLHFLNVLTTIAADQADPWRIIDPAAHRGEPGWDAIALLRNRWEDARRTGDPDRALRRRVDQLAEITGLDGPRTRELAGAVAADNLAWLLPRDPGHMFVAPYQVIIEWLRA